MIRTTLSKLKRIYSLAFVPHILRADARVIPSKFENLSTRVLRKPKSTRSSNEDKDQCEKCKRIIERAFAPNKPEIENTTVEADPTKPQEIRQANVQNETTCDKCNRLIAKAFGENETNKINKEATKHAPGKHAPYKGNRLQSTTDRENNEKLKQKIEIIDETPLVEVPIPKVEGFNTYPKVLGNAQQSTVLNFSDNSSYRSDANQTTNTHDTLDELAKRCLDTPSNQIDDRLLKEMEKLGIPQGSQRESDIPVVDQEIVQMMKKPRKPVQKSEIELEIRVLDRNPLNSTTIQESNIKSDKKYYSDPKDLQIIHPMQQDFVENDWNRSHLERKGLDNCNELEEVDHIPTHLKSEPHRNEKKINEGEAMTNTRHISSTIPPVQLADDRRIEHTVFATSKDDYKELVKNMKSHEKVKVNREAIQNLERDGRTPQDDPSTLSGDKSEQTESRRSYKVYNENSYILRNTYDTESTDFSLQKESFIPYRLNYVPSIGVEEFSPHTHHVMIKGCHDDIYNKYEEEPNINDLTDRERILPHHLLSDLSIISKDLNAASESAMVIQESYGFNYCSNENIKLERIQPYYLQADHSLISKEYSFTEPSILVKENLHQNYIIDADYRPQEYSEKYFENSPDIISTKQTPTKESSPTTEMSQREYTLPIDLYCKKSIAINVEDNGADPLITRKPENEIKQPTLPNEINLDDSIINVVPSYERVKELSEPVICSETSRLHEFELKNETKDTIEDQSQTQLFYGGIKPEAIVSPLLDKGTIHANQKEEVQNDSMPELNLEKEQMSLKELMKRVRERNRIELCREFVNKAQTIESLARKCGQPKMPCPPPARECPPKDPCPPFPCPSPKPPPPKPCKPACPDPCTPPPKPKSPTKKNPCAKFKNQKLPRIRDSLTVILTTLDPRLDMPNCNKALLNNMQSDSSSLKSLVTEDVVMKCNALGNLLRSAYLPGQIDASADKPTMASGVNSDCIAYARDYEPWIPIPSWPIPEKEKKQKFVCPKEGCKQIPPPPLSQPCKENPCSKLPKRSFSLIDIFSKKIDKNSVFDIGDL